MAASRVDDGFGGGGYTLSISAHVVCARLGTPSIVEPAMITCNGTFAPIVLWLITIGTAERVHLHHVVEASRQLNFGATEEEALAILGEPNARYAERRGFFFGRPRQWMYGTTINLQNLIVSELPFPNPIPINIRLFGYDDDDLVIDWTRDGKVAKIVRPELNVPDGAEDALKLCYSILNWMLLIWDRVEWRP